MKTTVVHINKPSSKLLELMRELRTEKEDAQNEIKNKWNTYFPEKK
jgi:hypothetical protein